MPSAIWTGAISLKASLAGAKPERARSNGDAPDLDSLSKDELYERARDADVKGRADMTKEELVAALSVSCG